MTNNFINFLKSFIYKWYNDVALGLLICMTVVMQPRPILNPIIASEHISNVIEGVYTKAAH